MLPSVVPVFNKQRPEGEPAKTYPLSPPVCVSMAAVMVIVLFRYAHVIEKHQNCILNTAGLSTGWICAAGLIMVGNFQVLPQFYFLIEFTNDDIIITHLIYRHLLCQGHSISFFILPMAAVVLSSVGICYHTSSYSR